MVAVSAFAVGFGLLWAALLLRVAIQVDLFRPLQKLPGQSSRGQRLIRHPGRLVDRHLQAGLDRHHMLRQVMVGHSLVDRFPPGATVDSDVTGGLVCHFYESLLLVKRGRVEIGDSAGVPVFYSSFGLAA